MRRASTAGFTLIEVMIAVVILAVGMSALFTSEAGAVRIAQRARTTTVATLLARCKMGEVEEKILKEGWPGDSIEGRDECCTDAEKEGFRCEWKVERVTLPELSADTGGLTAGLTGGLTAGGATGGEKGALPGPGGAPLAGGSAGGLGAGAPGGSLEGDGGILGSMITSAGSSGGDSDPFAQMAMEMTFPVMKPVIEEGVRRATVTVSWKEGGADQSFEVVQFIVNEVPMLPSESQTELLAPPGGGTAGVGGVAAGTTAGAGGTAAGAPPGGASPPGSTIR